MRYDFAAYQMITVSRTAVRLSASVVFELIRTSNPHARRADYGLRRALLKYAHDAACDGEGCDHHKTEPRRDHIDAWLARLDHLDTHNAAEAILTQHPTMLGFYAVLVLFDRAGGLYENLFDVLSEDAPMYLADFNPALPLTCPADLRDPSPWWAGARGFG